MEYKVITLNTEISSIFSRIFAYYTFVNCFFKYIVQKYMQFSVTISIQVTVDDY